MDLNTTYCYFFSSFFFFFFFLVAQDTIHADLLGVPYVQCLHNSTALNSTFTHNVNTALQNLTRLPSLGTKYANLSVGSGEAEADNVYAIFQCRGDLNAELCSECLSIAADRLPHSDCPASFDARIQLDGCYLRYGNESFLSPDFTFAAYLCSSASTTDPVALTAISDLIQNVTAQAPKEGGFSSASTDGEHAAAQCLGYLTESECSQCLSITPTYRTICNTSLGMQVHLTSCYSRIDPFQFLQTSSSPAPTAAATPAPTTANSAAPAPSPASANVLNTTHKGSKTSIIIIIASVIIAIVITLIACMILVQRYKASKITELHSECNESGNSVENGEGWSQLLLPTKAQVFSLEELEKATAYFHSSNKLGEGGYGPVYKGTLASGEQVAIKKLAIESHQGRQEFIHEISIITSVQHKNLIRLLGSCVEGQERIVVYEYFHNKSLDGILFGEQSDNRILDWPTRYEIVLGVAKGLAYLHEESCVRIIHRDIKPSNILLDHQLKPVIGDFGLARLVQDDETHVYTRVVGTIGYLAPEYVLHGDLSEKVDVFSFGVVSLEILAGKRNLKGKLLNSAWRLYEEGSILELVDTKLGDDFSSEQVIRIAHIALLCTQEDPKQRPTMSTITLQLIGESDILELPQKPTFVNSSESKVNEDTTSSRLEFSIF